MLKDSARNVSGNMNTKLGRVSPSARNACAALQANCKQSDARRKVDGRTIVRQRSGSGVEDVNRDPATSNCWSSLVLILFL